MDYRELYDAIIDEIKLLKNADLADDYRLCKALAACYELQEYIASKLAEDAYCEYMLQQTPRSWIPGF